ncbi:MAG TPA: N-acetylmuramoyl-L-alanine amidase [bacterium]|nr:N-acetylmuramoyl-L-alanine amidase [bacterium]HMW34205.1 N-acetylmuramoyl-L-alanine amidase [bacterium]HMY36310.1 N-acetylmuramoyl-L-alanine amidase [bacterium]HNE82975.1 N-acetylmuramoyl-L-alanine amidase [bacterium]HNH29576.1 N-acetylmuramoyl-L-alanine amidase [bacterium]
MKIYLEAGVGFQSGTDAYGNEITGSSNTELTVKYLQEYLNNQSEIRDRKTEVITTSNAATVLETMQPEDIFLTVHLNYYRQPQGVGLRGFYRSSRKLNSEKCKALAITVTKALHDHTDVYYHGVFNEQRNNKPQLEPVLSTKATAALVEVGFNDDFKTKSQSEMLHKNLAEGLGKGLVRHINAIR